MEGLNLKQIENAVEYVAADPIQEPAAPAPIETPKKQPVATTNKTVPVQFGFTDEAANEDDMAPVREILSSGEVEADEMSMGIGMELLTVNEVAAFLKGTYELQGWLTFQDIWEREDSFFNDIAMGILPQINALAARVPAIGHAVKTVSAAGSWGKLIWDMAGSWIMVNRRKQALALEKLEEEERKAQNAGYSNQSTYSTGGIIVP
jgi:hypothetical protein